MKTDYWQFYVQDGMRYLALPDGTTIPTRHSPECISAIYDLKSPEGIRWFIDEIRRAEFPNELSNNLRSVVERFNLTDKQNILDFGAGSGASSVALAHMGFKRVETVEIDTRLIEIARLRARDFGYQDQIGFHKIEPGEKLPFTDQYFDLVVCYAVIEHIHPDQRESVLQDLWRVLKPKGVLLVLETPNILFPYGNHYPFLYFTPWMPLPLVKAYGRLRGRINGPVSDEQLYLAGLRGTTIWHVMRYIGGNGRLLPSLESNPEEEYLRLSSNKPGNQLKQALKKMIIRAYQRGLKPFGIPLCAIFPQLNFGIEKIK